MGWKCFWWKFGFCPQECSEYCLLWHVDPLSIATELHTEDLNWCPIWLCWGQNKKRKQTITGQWYVQGWQIKATLPRFATLCCCRFPSKTSFHPEMVWVSFLKFLALLSKLETLHQLKMFYNWPIITTKHFLKQKCERQRQLFLSREHSWPVTTPEGSGSNSKWFVLTFPVVPDQLLTGAASGSLRSSPVTWTLRLLDACLHRLTASTSISLELYTSLDLFSTRPSCVPHCWFTRSLPSPSAFMTIKGEDQTHGATPSFFQRLLATFLHPSKNAPTFLF